VGRVVLVNMRSSKIGRLVCVASVLAGVGLGQDPSAVRTIYGAVTKIDAAARELVVKADSGGEIAITLQPTASFRRVTPGEKDLRNAASIALTDIGVGDRVMARGKSSEDQKSVTATLIVVMSQTDIAKKQAAERADWEKRGVVGEVIAVAPDQITLKVRGKPMTIALAPNAIVRRYVPDSVKFADAKLSTLAEIKTGDQVRARGEKSEDGSKMTAEEIVSGTFRTIAGLVVSVDAQQNQMRINDLDTKKPVVVKINPDSNLRRLNPQVAQMIAMRVHGGAEGGRGGQPEGPRPAGSPGGPVGMRPGGMDIQQIIDRSPNIALADLKAGEPIVVSSTLGATAGQMTAITLLAGVEPILRRPGRSDMSLGGWSLDMGGEGGIP